MIYLSEIDLIDGRDVVSEKRVSFCDVSFQLYFLILRMVMPFTKQNYHRPTLNQHEYEIHIVKLNIFHVPHNLIYLTKYVKTIQQNRYQE